MKDLIKKFESLKLSHELPNGNNGEYNQGFVKAMNIAIKEVENIDALHGVVGQSKQLLAFLEWYDFNVCQNDCRIRDELVEDFLSQ